MVSTDGSGLIGRGFGLDSDPDLTGRGFGLFSSLSSIKFGSVSLDA
jgi:hypothetical protein